MKIKELYFKNNARRWELEKTKFSDDLTLLVGATGVGKTQILKAIEKLINISRGYAYNGVEWDLHFTYDNGENYRWTGEFETIEGQEQQEFKSGESSGSERVPRLMNEELYLEGQLVFERQESSVKYEKKDVPKVSPHTSILSLFTKEDKIKPVKLAFLSITNIDYYEERELIKKSRSVMLDQIYKQSEEFKPRQNSTALLMLQYTNLPLLERLMYTYDFQRKAFDEIIDDFKDTFAQLEDVRFKYIEKDDAYALQIREHGTDWTSIDGISSGMFKTLLHIVGLRLTSDGSVILIDEFENSLGANCIDVVADNLTNPGRDIQYIITSHHPYIINNIPMKHWKLVTRKGHKVSTLTAEQLKLGKSKHEAFKQLVNLDQFTEGIS